MGIFSKWFGREVTVIKPTPLQVKEVEAQRLHDAGKHIIDQINSLKREVDGLYDQLDLDAQEYSRLCKEIDAEGGKTPEHWKVMKVIQKGLEVGDALRIASKKKGMN